MNRMVLDGTAIKETTMNAILTERLRQAKTQKRLAHEAGIDARTLRKIEKGEDVSLETRRLVCLALGIAPDFPVPTEAASRGETVSPERYVPLRSNWELAAHLLAISMCVCCVVLFYHNAQANWPNARMVISESTPCLGDADAAARSDVTAAIKTVDIREVSVRKATDSCEVIINMKVDLPADTIIEQMSKNGIKAKLDAYRPVVIPWTYDTFSEGRIWR